jgi:hypothetical protein
MRRDWWILFCLAGFAVLLSASSSVFAVDCAPRAKACELVNSEDDIFVGRVISPIDQTGAIRVQVLRVYKGLVSGEIVIDFGPWDVTFQTGESYLFYSSPAEQDHGARHESDACLTMPLSSVKADELACLDGLNRGPRTGSVFGRLERNFNSQDHEPLTGIPILLNNGKRTYSGITDREGRFDIADLPLGVYQLSAKLPETLTLDGDEQMVIFRHGCFNADLEAMNNATITGRITLPPGLKVEGTRVFAVSTTGAVGGRDATADSQGRYKIRGLATGEYVVGVNTEALPPRIEAPYPPTYFPGTRSFEEAKKFVISGPTNFPDVNISVPVASEIVYLNVKATFEDGRPVQDEMIGVSYNGAGIGSGNRTNVEGVASLSVRRGERFFLMGYSGTALGCFPPLPIGPEVYPDTIHVVYSTDGCREDFNITHLGFLHYQLHDKFNQVPVTVSFPDGSPAYNADVTLMSKRDLVPFSSGFRTDKTGYLDLPMPTNQEFQVDASFFGPGIECKSQSLLFNTDRGIRWRELGSGQSSLPSWDNVPASTAPIHLMLGGTSCKPGTP